MRERPEIWVKAMRDQSFKVAATVLEWRLFLRLRPTTQSERQTVAIYCRSFSFEEHDY
ncbi:hypothetical protein Hdeb2414_s0015g00444791 [Helianthus debilis subsp. tardiflorus]